MEMLHFKKEGEKEVEEILKCYPRIPVELSGSPMLFISKKRTGLRYDSPGLPEWLLVAVHWGWWESRGRTGDRDGKVQSLQSF